MATANTIFKDILGVKGIVVEKHETYTDSNQVVYLRVKARVAAKERHRCPVCGRNCKRYDALHSRKVWRALDYRLHRRISSQRGALCGCVSCGRVDQ